MHKCGSCDGTGKCQNERHDLVNGMATAVLGSGPCPSCGNEDMLPGKCSACGGTGWQRDSIDRLVGLNDENEREDADAEPISMPRSRPVSDDEPIAYYSSSKEPFKPVGCGCGTSLAMAITVPCTVIGYHFLHRVTNHHVPLEEKALILCFLLSPLLVYGFLNLVKWLVWKI